VVAATPVFEPDFPPEVQQQLTNLRAHPPQIAAGKNCGRSAKSFSGPPSITILPDRPSTKIEVAERQPNGDVKVLIGIADVDAFVPKHTPIDQPRRPKKLQPSTPDPATSPHACPRNFSAGKTSLLRKSGLSKAWVD